MSQRYREYLSPSVAGPSTWPADVYGPPPLTFPTSNVPDEPIRRPPPPQIPSPPVPHASMSRSIPSVPLPSSEAMLITAQNPYVVEYINKLSHWKTSGILPPRLVGLDRPLVNKKQRMSEACWVASVANVNAVLNRATPDLSKVGCMCVLAVAALSLLDSPTSVACPALWGDSVYNQTAEVVQKICYDLEPCPIQPPVFWMGLQQMKFYFRRNVKPFMLKAAPKPAHRKAEKPKAVAAPVQAPPPEPREVGGKLLRGRKVSYVTGAPLKMSEKAKGKRKASADDDSQPSARKPKTRQAKQEYIAAMVPPADAILPLAVDATPDVDDLPRKPAPPAPTRRSTRAAGTPALAPPPPVAAVPPPLLPAPTHQRRTTGTSAPPPAIPDTAERENAQPSAKALGKRKAAGLEEDVQVPPAKRARQKRPPLAVTVALGQMQGTPMQTRARSRGAGRT
ncbi:hypothetical protein B0H21DRAFT_894810 [Amylocystis lapponica]|nr:hypothetical protein B0H21DRAFT_894810 [Amylocystis lapponica]